MFNLNACATAGKINRVSIGMSKDQVIDRMGDPDSSKGSDNGVEVLSYLLSSTNTDWWFGRTNEYWVILKDNKTVQYGRAGDFGNAIPNTHKIIIQHQ